MSSFYSFIRENIVLATIELAAENKKSSLNLNNSDLKEIPQSLLKLRNLTKLYLKKNSLKNLPQDICNLKFLKVLAMDYNLLYSIPPEIGKLCDLVCLNLSYNNLNYLIPEIGQLSKLEVLWLNHTNLRSLPPEIGDCSFLDTLGARGNLLQELPPEIGMLHRLRWLTLEGNLLSSVPKEIIGLESLIHLNLSNNHFKNLPHLESLNTLKFLILSRNFITEMDMASIERMAFMKQIDLAENPISSNLNNTHIKNLRASINSEIQADSGESHDSDLDSENWEDSAPSSDLDATDSTVDNIHFDEILENALPLLVKFTLTGP